MRDNVQITCSVLESAAEQSEMEVLCCKNDVCVGALSVNFTNALFYVFSLAFHFISFA